MITVKERLFVLETENTTYAFAASPTGFLVHLYYGRAISMEGDALAALSQKCANQNGCSIIADSSEPNVCLDDVCLEVSGRGKGDMREPFAELELADGSRTVDFRYERYELEKTDEMPAMEASGKPKKTDKTFSDGLPHAYDESGRAERLSVFLREKNSGGLLELVYTVYGDCDCITRFAILHNEGEKELIVRRLMSLQLDLEADTLKVVSFHGDWVREMAKHDTLFSSGKFVSDTLTGYSSNKTNPFFIVAEPGAKEEAGECYAFNLLYSGNHRECVEFGGHGKARVLSGIHPDTFSWRLGAGESFASPEAVMTYSAEGYQGISIRMHDFVREHIVRGKWKKKERPVLINSWEASYFAVNERRLLKLAKEAAEAGIELFVLDDGWFGKRNDDKSSLGDWYDNKEKLPGGLSGLSKKIKALGLTFGIWVEPEMVSEDSDLYRAHPDWAVQIPGQAHSVGRNQFVLDFSRTEVQDYILEAIGDVFTRGEVSYVKWDMNRHMSDFYSAALPAERQGEFAHRYMLGLYRVLSELTGRFPDILFEGCASGGNRFDLGILCYMPQIWASDNTDAVSRASIQNGYSYGYPQSVYTAHVSSCPNHQTLRLTPLATRFAIASAGVLGYECNLCDMGAEDLKEIKEQIEIYKKWRNVLQFGQLYRCGGSVGIGFGSTPAGKNTVTGGFVSGQFDTSLVRWTAVSKDKKQAVGILMQGQVLANYSHEVFRTKGLEEALQYRFYNRVVKHDIRRMGDLINTMAPFHVKQDSLCHDVIAKFVKLDGEQEDVTVSGSLLNHAGIRLAQSFAGTGYGENTRLYSDYDARMYFIEAKEE